MRMQPIVHAGIPTRADFNRLVDFVNSLILQQSPDLMVSHDKSGTIATLKSRRAQAGTVYLCKVKSGSGTVYTVTRLSDGTTDLASVYVGVGVDLAADVKVGVVKEDVTISSTVYHYWGWPIDPYSALYECT